MNNQLYNNLVQYLSTQQYPDNFSIEQQTQLQKQSTNFELITNLLYKKNKRNSTLRTRVIQKQELSSILYMFHNDPTAAHASKERMLDKVKSRYYWPQMFE